MWFICIILIDNFFAKSTHASVRLENTYNKGFLHFNSINYLNFQRQVTEGVGVRSIRTSVP